MCSQLLLALVSLWQLLWWGSLGLLTMLAVLTHGCCSLPKPKDDIYPLLHPTMHCWASSSDLYVGCEEGHLLMINSETLKVTVLQKMEALPLLGKRLFCPEPGSTAVGLAGHTVHSGTLVPDFPLA